MKTLAIILSLSFIFFSCKDKAEPKVSELLIGKWKLIEYKEENQQWRDTMGTFYNFKNDSLVNTKIFNNACDRKYTLNETSSSLIQVTFPNYETGCFYPYWITINVATINSSKMEITYLDEIGGAIVKKYERYLKE